MKKTDKALEGNGNVENRPGTSSSPKGAENNPGVTYGIGIPNAASHKKLNNDSAGKSSNNNRKWHFSSERPIF